MTSIKYPLIAYIFPIVVVFGLLYLFVAFDQKETFAGYGDASCTVSQSVVVVGTTSQEVVANNARYAWVRIQQPMTATNTVSLGFGIVATASSSIQLGTQASSVAPDRVEFGLNTDFPYTGSVQALANTASSVLFITRCIY